MSNPISFDRKSKRPEAAQLTADAASATIRTIIAALSADDRDKVLRELSEVIRAMPAPQAGEVLGAIVRFLPKQTEWTTNEIKDQVKAEGVEATHKEIYNALGYLTRKGHIHKAGYGQYRTDGSVVTDAMDFGGGPVKFSEHFD